MSRNTESGFFPTVKCAQCARDIEISQMGDHICRGGQPSPPPESHINFGKVSYEPKITTEQPNLGRSMPPRVDTSAANRPFLGQEDLTPISMSSATSISPTTPNGSYRLAPGRANAPKRSMTSPNYGVSSNEPRSSNLDCAFPPFPTAPKNIPTGLTVIAQSDAMYAPVSPRNVSGGGLLQRMNSIAPGPFALKGRRTATEESTAPGHKRQQSVKLPASNLEISIEPIRPSTSGGHTRNTSSKGSGSGMGLPRAPKTEAYGGFGGRAANDGSEPSFLRPEDRSRTFPSSSAGSSMRRPSEATVRTPSNDPPARRVNGTDDRPRKPSTGPDRSRTAPPRGVSMYKPHGEGFLNLGDVPPVPDNVNLDAEFGTSNPYHAPSASHSSDGSGYSENSKASSRSSPPSSVRADSPINASSSSNDIDLDVLMSEVESSMADLMPRDIPSISPPRIKKTPYVNTSTTVPQPIAQSSRNPSIPIAQNGQLSTSPLQTSSFGTSPTSPKKPIRRGTGSKGTCKGCKQPITGKSISSADGRLTGRYHKECFACTTCLEPFKTSEFYVINDAPYCHWHYHKLNNSICATCDKGIEGQYLENERKKKFHPGCLTCADCKRSLRNDYFEENGRIYCERDAFRRAQLQQRGRGGQQGQFLGVNNGTSRMERRTTRLMMM